VLFADATARHALHQQFNSQHPEFSHDFSTQRREAMRLALQHCGENPLLAEAAFEVFFAERNRVTLYDDALAGLAFLASRLPLVALSNGNADIHRIGIGAYFKASISAQQFGVGKPDPRIFHAAAQAAGAQPHEVLHVGDDAALDVLAALDCGMQTVWVNRENQPWPHAVEPHLSVTTLTELCDLLGA
jgi:putative hydrolase of the HAD superfamily